jgi:hypothetical protein
MCKTAAHAASVFTIVRCAVTQRAKITEVARGDGQVVPHGRRCDQEIMDTDGRAALLKVSPNPCMGTAHLEVDSEHRKNARNTYLCLCTLTCLRGQPELRQQTRVLRGSED